MTGVQTCALRSLPSKNITGISEESSHFRRGELNVSTHNEDGTNFGYYKIALSELVRALKLADIEFVVVKKKRQQYARLCVEREGFNYED